MSERKISLVTMGAGNTIVLKETLESFKGIVDEVIYGDLLVFQEDRDLLYTYKSEYNINIQKLPFNYIFQMGFDSVLNYLIAHAKNDLCLYMNTSEVIDIDYGINKIVDDNPDCNSFYFSHAVEKHRWFRLNDRKFLRWSGRLHEEPRGNDKPYFKPILQMKDLEKDMSDPFKVSVLNSIKEMCYWQQLINIVDSPFLKAATHEHWVNFAKEQYDSMKERLSKKGNQYEAFKVGDFDMFIHEIKNSKYFEETTFISSGGLNFQGARKEIL